MVTEVVGRLGNFPVFVELPGNDFTGSSDLGKRQYNSFV